MLRRFFRGRAFVCRLGCGARMHVVGAEEKRWIGIQVYSSMFWRLLPGSSREAFSRSCSQNLSGNDFGGVLMAW